MNGHHSCKNTADTSSVKVLKARNSEKVFFYIIKCTSSEMISTQGKVYLHFGSYDVVNRIRIKYSCYLNTKSPINTVGF